MTESYPLYWPATRKRTDAWRRQRSRFATGFGASVNRVMAELRLLGARHSVVSTNVPLRRDGLPLAQAKRVEDPGVAVYFLYQDKQTCFACDRWDKVEDNIHAIAKTIEALRGIARWGTGDMLAAAFSGFTQLPSPDDWRQYFGSANTMEEVEHLYRVKARALHPDVGGSHAEMSKLNRARDAARKALTHQ